MYCFLLSRYKQVKRLCPHCDYTWSDDMTSLMVNLKKVKFLTCNYIYVCMLIISKEHLNFIILFVK